eukprot:6657316-Prymnesium_polylepis.2
MPPPTRAQAFDAFTTERLGVRRSLTLKRRAQHQPLATPPCTARRRRVHPGRGDWRGLRASVAQAGGVLSHGRLRAQGDHDGRPAGERVALSGVGGRVCAASDDCPHAECERAGLLSAFLRGVQDDRSAEGDVAESRGRLRDVSGLVPSRCQPDIRWCQRERCNRQASGRGVGAAAPVHPAGRGRWLSPFRCFAVEAEGAKCLWHDRQGTRRTVPIHEHTHNKELQGARGP